MGDGGEREGPRGLSGQSGRAKEERQRIVVLKKGDEEEAMRAPKLGLARTVESWGWKEGKEI